MNEKSPRSTIRKAIEWLWDTTVMINLIAFVLSRGLFQLGLLASAVWLPWKMVADNLLWRPGLWLILLLIWWSTANILYLVYLHFFTDPL